MTLYFHADYLINYQVFLDYENLKTSSAAYFGGILKGIGHRTFKVIELFFTSAYSVSSAEVLTQIMPNITIWHSDGK